MQRTKKFLFERSFDDPNRLYLPGERRRAEIEAEAAAFAAEQAARDMAAAQAVVPDVVSAAEQLKAQIEAAREEGYVQGHTAALEEAETAREHYIADSLSLIAQGLEKVAEQQRAAEEQTANHALRMVYGIVRKLLPPVAQAHAAEAIGEFVREVLPLATSEPRLVIRAHSMVTADLEPRLQEVMAKSSFRGTFVVEADYELQPGDCRIEWQGGGADRDEVRIWNDIRGAIATHFGDLDIDALDKAADTASPAQAG